MFIGVTFFIILAVLLTYINTMSHKRTFLDAVLKNVGECIAIYDIRGNLFFKNKITCKYMPSTLHVNEEDQIQFYKMDGKTLLEKEENPFFRALNGEDIHGEEVWLEVNGKSSYIVNINSKILFSRYHRVLGILFIIQDITNQKWSEKRLEISEQRYKSLFEFHPDAVCWLDLKGRLIRNNMAAETIMGLTKEQLPPLFSSIVLVDNRTELEDVLKEAGKGISNTIEIIIVHPINGFVSLRITTVPIYIEKDVIGLYLIAKDITEQRRLEEKMNYMEYHDELTGLPNRRLFEEYVEQMIHSCKEEAVVLLLDLDRFKYINETGGHAQGDLLLRAVATRIKNGIGDKGFVSRQGGDEFTIILTNSNRRAAELIAKEILKTLNRPFSIMDQECMITASIGISIYPHHGLTCEELLKNADIAMYEAKAQMKNSYSIFTPDMSTRTTRKMELEHELRKALNNHEFSVYYQPQVDLRSMRIVGMEALVRWNHPKFGLVSPNEFIPLAEETGLIIPIGEWVFREACYQADVWLKDGFDNLTIGINLSLAQFKSENLHSKIATLLNEITLDPSRVKLEITESIAMQQDENMIISKLKELKSLGVQISIDDFGTGYSSLSYLRAFPMDQLKIDKSFTKEITNENTDSAIIRAIIAMAHSLNLQVIAEGIEDKVQLRFLQKLGCTEGQGYLFSRPLSVADATKLLGQFNFLELVTQNEKEKHLVTIAKSS